MTYVRPHVRKDGTYVKGHTRRTSPRAAQPATMPRTATTARRTPAPRRGPAQDGPTTYVRAHVRGDGVHVRGHRRSISPRTVAVATSSGGGFLLLILLLALAGGPGASSKTPTSTTPSHSASVPVHRR